ncbi:MULTISPECIES: hypothetical protein [Rhizobium/Agrobacterium group]|uniref:hypothetical protein n=1 Tax=Rhizobium/Agrobacterium group TaxID=227290 RepID=UPI001ADCBD7F|nr:MULTISPECIES: hypothetical protein [Rhizobium/Agrobacterium group]MBO9111893.1 hypothetical protein [Agrobacterium sp. S2/73]QXZ76257.1 hypothetical protein J5276_25170 [Agrobacterium sp. S7/73]QYA17196.1 hypothetical protein J5284_31545 [Rhizobium sp. AB2/73]UEQ85230.1 hypothetical protein I8E17_32510 [Rhizobium sp. AB2/73]
MRIVVRNSPGNGLAELTATEAAALRAWYGDAASNEEKAIALAAIRQARVMNGWIECDCLTGRFQPLLAPIQQERTFTLRRLTPKDADPLRHEERPNHAHICPFHVDRDATPALVDQSYHIRPVRKSDRSYIDALPAIPDRLADVVDRDPARSLERNDRPSRLGGILWRLLDDADMNVIRPLQEDANLALRDQLSKLRAAAKELRVLRTWTLNALLSTWAADYREPDSRWQRLLETSRPDWPATLRRTGFMLLLSTSVSPQAIMPASSSRPIDVVGKVRQPLRGDPARRGPFLTLLNVDFQDDDEGPVRAIQAYAQPVYNGDTLFPVESGFEREVSHLLFWLQQSLFDAAPELRIKITKPLFASETLLGPCRPDFVIEATYKERKPVTLIIEAFGMEIEKYREAKDKTVQRMKHLGPIFGIFPEDLAEANASSTAKRLQDWVIDQIRHA